MTAYSFCENCGATEEVEAFISNDLKTIFRFKRCGKTYRGTL